MGRPRADAELRAGSSAHYEDPAYYTQAYRGRTIDVRYYEALARRRRGPVLEYGCGNGRITLPIARAGVEIVGVDASAPMLADLRARLAREPEAVRRRVAVRRGDMRSARLGRRFPLVLCPFNTFLHLYTHRDVERFLARAREHLAPGGELVLDVSIPDVSLLARRPDRPCASPRFRYPLSADPAGAGGRAGARKGPLVRYRERFDYDPIRQILFVAMEFEPVGGGEPWMTPLAHRQFFPRELETILRCAGFAIRGWYGDFEPRPPAPDDATLVVHCRAARAR